MIVLGETANGFEHTIYTWEKDGFVVNSFLKDYHIKCNSSFATLTIPRSYFKDDFEYWICIVNNFNGELDYYPDDEDNPYAYFKFGETRKKTPTASGEIILKLKIDSKIMYVNDTPLEMDVSPIIIEGRTLLPIRYIAEPLGAEVGWDGTEKKVTVSLDDIFIELWIGKNTARVNGVEKPIDPNNPKVKPIIVPPGRTMLPVRFVAENLGCKVDWEQETRTVIITYKKRLPRVVKSIGREGGVIETDTTQIIIPEGAFSEEVEIELYEEAPKEEDIVSKVYRVKGFPTSYSKPITIKVKINGNYKEKVFLKVEYEGFIYDYGGIGIIKDFLKGGVSSGYLIATLPPIEGESGSKGLKASPKGVGFIRIANFDFKYSCSTLVSPSMKIVSYKTEDNHFELSYPNNIDVKKIKKIGNFLEEAYKKFLDLGFSYKERGSWPMNVYLLNLGKEAYGYYSNSIFGNNYGYIE
ncbi:MAG: hypothetical protein DRI28_03320, partial [Caldiserica bacterium]